MNLFQNVKGKEIPLDFGWINEPKVWNCKDGGIEIIASPGADYFNDPTGSHISNSGNFLYTIVKGDFDLVTRVEVNMKAMFDSGCLMIMADDNNWAKICYEYWLNEPAIVSVVTRIKSDDCPSLRIGEVKPYLRLLRSGNTFGFHYSLDGIGWTLIRYFSLDVTEEIKAGIVAQSPTGDGCHINFEFLSLEVRKIENASSVNS